MSNPVKLVIKPRTHDLGQFDVVPVILLGGTPIDGKSHLWWNFASSSKERLEQAKDDQKNKRFDRIEGGDEFITLSEK
jgi:redox-sensitive bicupin YhaK (pirin superfamily)